MSNIFQNLQLQRIADAIENGDAGGTITIDVTGAGDMQGATASTAGVHGLVPAPQAGDNEKVLSGAGTWVEQSAGGGVDYSLSEQDTGLKWIDGKTIYQKTLSFTVSGGGYVNNPTGITGIDTLVKHEEIGRITDFIVNGTSYKNPPFSDYSVAMMYAFADDELHADYRATSEAVGATFYITVWYTKI